ncbi:MAG: MFS transporter [Proteobacteria bacterium]|nr:MFS transporter [Pseudomonadota bacterium]
MTSAAPSMGGARPVKVVGMISLGHGLNHLFNMIVPPLAITWTKDFGIGYAEVGAIMAASAITSASAVLPVGFLVDRMPARHVLVAGMTLISLAVIGLGVADSYWQLLAFAVLLGLGNTVFHPCDYSILSATAPKAWLGRAFSVHTFAGYVGFALTPLIISGALLWWSWRGALILLGLMGLAMAATFWFNRHDLRDDRDAAMAQGSERKRPGIAEGLKLLLSLPLLMCFAFFLLVTIAMWGFDAFLPAALFEHNGLPEVMGNYALSAFFGASALGILIGGQIADRTRRHGLVAAMGFGIAAVSILLIGELATGPLMVFALIGLAGIGGGIVTPNRDLIVRQVTPPGQIGKVFAFMTVAMDTGSTVAPPAFGLLMDLGGAAWLFRISALLLLLAILTVTATRRVHGRMEIR